MQIKVINAYLGTGDTVRNVGGRVARTMTTLSACLSVCLCVRVCGAIIIDLLAIMAFKSRVPAEKYLHKICIDNS